MCRITLHHMEDYRLGAQGSASTMYYESDVLEFTFRMP
jgi:hypothetical protein